MREWAVWKIKVISSMDVLFLLSEYFVTSMVKKNCLEVIVLDNIEILDKKFRIENMWRKCC